MTKFTIKEPVETVCPDGLYKGTFGGYVCEFKVPDVGVVTINTVNAVRGFGYEVTVAVVKNKAVVFLDDGSVMLTH
jgi:hypothetical protein